MFFTASREFIFFFFAGNPLFFQHADKVFLDPVIRYLRGKIYHKLIFIRTGADLQGIRACKDTEPVNIRLIFRREFENSDIGIYCCNTSSSQICTCNEEISFDLQWDCTYERILFQTDITVHIHCDPVLLKFFFKLVFYGLQKLFESCTFLKFIAYFDPAKEISH